MFSPNQAVSFQPQPQYHPALQQTQNFYIGMNQIMPPSSDHGKIENQMNDLFNMSQNMASMLNSQVNGGGQPKRKIKTAGLN